MLGSVLGSLLAIGSGGVIGLVLGVIGGGGSILAVPCTLVYGVGPHSAHVAIGTAATAVALNALVEARPARPPGTAALALRRGLQRRRNSVAPWPARRSARCSTGRSCAGAVRPADGAGRRPDAARPAAGQPSPWLSARDLAAALVPRVALGLGVGLMSGLR
ncbi:MAG: hypothetical protein U1E23_03355 [Reyranellaceae bacterium]